MQLSLVNFWSYFWRKVKTGFSPLRALHFSIKVLWLWSSSLGVVKFVNSSLVFPIFYLPSTSANVSCKDRWGATGSFQDISFLKQAFSFLGWKFGEKISWGYIGEKGVITLFYFWRCFFFFGRLFGERLETLKNDQQCITVM